MYKKQTSMSSISSSEYYPTSDSSTDEEYEQQQEELFAEKRRDEASHELWDLMLRNNIRSPLNGPMDGAMLNSCLRGDVRMCDVVCGEKLRYSNKVPVVDTITKERISEFREVARMMTRHYAPESARFMSYVNNVTACLIKYHYKL